MDKESLSIMLHGEMDMPKRGYVSSNTFQKNIILLIPKKEMSTIETLMEMLIVVTTIVS